MRSALNRSRFLVSVSALLMTLAGSPADARDERERVSVQNLIDALKTELLIEATVSTAIVATNPLLVSVQPVEGSVGRPTFVMSFDESFLAGLEGDELRAIVAHELGHVWIFTHHPYLQTERLANTVAMRAVTRASLERVYTKVWAHEGSKGDLAHFLGQ